MPVLRKFLLRHRVLRYAWYVLLAILILAAIALFVWIAGVLPGMWL